MAIGIFVVLSGEDLSESQNFAIAGKKYPLNTPRNIARKIQRVRYLSSSFSLDFISDSLKIISNTPISSQNTHRQVLCYLVYR